MRVIALVLTFAAVATSGCCMFRDPEPCPVVHCPGAPACAPCTEKRGG
jgi:hypothetical protein